VDIDGAVFVDETAVASRADFTPEAQDAMQQRLRGNKNKTEKMRFIELENKISRRLRAE
jgi:hypothetical protein